MNKESRQVKTIRFPEKKIKKKINASGFLLFQRKAGVPLPAIFAMAVLDKGVTLVLRETMMANAVSTLLLTDQIKSTTATSVIVSNHIFNQTQ